MKETCKGQRISPVRLLIAKVSRLIVMIAAIAGASGAANVHAQSASLREYQIKAAFLYNFVKFVEWPAEALPPPSVTMNVCVLGDDPFGVALDSIEGKTVKGRILEVKRFKTVQALEPCHVLFISSSEKKRLARIVETLKGSSVLTVGEMDRFAERGGIINLIITKNRVRFEINEGAAERAGLKISSKLLKLAEVVRD
ncbi:MAG: YfiR family protein [Candidatus Methylomirabilales bacterium]